MRAVAHGWKPDRIKGPSRAVAREFVNADRKYSGGFAENRYWTGGLAAMNEINSGVPVTLSFQEGGPVDLSDWRHTGGGRQRMITRDRIRELEEQGYTEGAGHIWYPPPGTILAPGGTSSTTPAAPPPIPIDMESPDDLMLRAVREDQGWTYDPSNSTMRPPETTVPGAGAAATPPRIIPGAVGTPAASNPFGSDPRAPNMVGALPGLTRAEQTAARRETPYREQLRAHRARVVAALNPAPPVAAGGMSGQMVPPGAIAGDLQNPIYGARGGHMNYQAGGAVAAPVERPTPITGGGPAIPGHPEGTNPNRPGTALYSRWEKRYHYDPPPPPTDPMPAPDEGGGITGWLLEKLGLSPDFKEGTADELEAMGEARGGRVGYQVGGLAQAQGQFRPPAGGVPPSFRGLPPRAGGIPPRMAPSAAPPGQRFAGGSPGFYAPGGPGRGGGAQADLGPGGGGIPGGPRVPPNMRGYLQKQRMMNRPPANVGGGVNRVGQQDQQGGLARALQRGTGRPPMSRRAGFPGGGVR